MTPDGTTVVFDPHVLGAIGAIVIALLALLVHIVLQMPKQPPSKTPPSDFPLFPGF